MLQAGDCQIPFAEESAAEMTALLRALRKRLPRAQIVLLAPLPKGDFWPNRCTPAFRVFNDALEVHKLSTHIFANGGNLRHNVWALIHLYSCCRGPHMQTLWLHYCEH